MWIFVVIPACLWVSNAVAAPALPGAKGGGVFVLDNCDPDYKGKAAYVDNLSFIDASGKLVFRVSGLNSCETVGCNRQVAFDAKRGHVWVVETVGYKVRKFDLDGKELVAIKDIQANAAAVDPATGNLWVLGSNGTIYGDKTRVYSPEGKELAVHDFSGLDLVYDAKSKAFWIASKTLLKVDSTGKKLVEQKLTAWCCSSLDVNPTTGQVWVSVRSHPDVAGSRNELLAFDSDGKRLHTIDYGNRSPFNVSVDKKSGSVWVVDFGTGVRRYSSEGKLELDRKAEALAAHADSATGELWVVTRDETIRMDATGKIIRQIKHVGPTTQAWVAGP
jgi:DNA-binding beta-propeller fold protein YncE